VLGYPVQVFEERMGDEKIETGVALALNYFQGLLENNFQGIGGVLFVDKPVRFEA
jgi:hypothetical protein